VHSANLYSLVNTSWGDAAFQLGSTEILADPAFIDLASGDYRLQATSPAVDSGLSLGIHHRRRRSPRAVGRRARPRRLRIALTRSIGERLESLKYRPD
jgi:hypothetical protein